ncbi:MAG: hypothetical protein GDA43_20615 [Hormoscilla sp. SP5CHS1]|nr:hypothetical protein [Hormoscilla sp. SP12CHS1]MBC6455306.1 hypothetical protein [Hormoscilla sp. SP5CHS1]
MEGDDDFRFPEAIALSILQVCDRPLLFPTQDYTGATTGGSAGGQRPRPGFFYQPDGLCNSYERNPVSTSRVVICPKLLANVELDPIDPVIWLYMVDLRFDS